MAEDKSKTILDHLDTWLSRQKNAASLVPQVQRLTEEVEWQDQPWGDSKSMAPPEVSREVDERLDREYDLVKLGVPLPPNCKSFLIGTFAAFKANSATLICHRILKI